MHITRLRVRTYECDPYNHVNNSVYLNYMEYARMEYLLDNDFDYEGFVKAGYGLFITEIKIKYKKPALPNQKIEIHSKMIRRGKIKGTFSQEIYTQEGELISQAEVSWACVKEGKRPCPIPAEFERKKLD